MKNERQEISFEENNSKYNTSNSNENKKLISEFVRVKKIKTEKKQINNIFFHMIKVFIFEFILIILPKKVLNGYSIELKVWKTGYQQILSNKYSGKKPSAIYINKEVQILRENKVYIDKIDYLIKLEWENQAEVVKQSTSSFIAVMIGMILLVINSFVVLNFVEVISATLILSIIVVLFIVIDSILYLYLDKKGSNQFNKLTI